MVKTVGFLHNYLALGGSDRISSETAKYFASLGIKSILICQKWVKEELPLPDETLSEVKVLEDKTKLLSKINTEAILNYIDKYQIERLFICCPIKFIPRKLSQHPTCRLIFWEHSCPMFQYHSQRQKALEKKELSILNKISWLLFGQFYFAKYGFARLKLVHRYRRIIRSVSKYIVLTESYATELARELNLSNEEKQKFYTIKNTISLREEPQLHKQKIITYLGRLSLSDKRVDRLLYVWQKCYQDLPDWSFKIYGNGIDEAKLKVLANQLKLERLEFCGFTQETEKVYDKASILCLSSDVESWGLVLTEAQNNAVIPIAFDVSEGVHSIIGEDAGILVPPFDLEAYAESLKKLCLDDELRQSLQKNCLLKRLDYTQETNAKVWQELLNENF